MAPVNFISKTDDLLLAVKNASKGRLQRQANGMYSAATNTGRAEVISNELLSTAHLRLNNGDIFTRTIVNNKPVDSACISGLQVLDGSDMKAADGLWNAFLNTIFG